MLDTEKLTLQELLLLFEGLGELEIEERESEYAVWKELRGLCRKELLKRGVK